MSDERATGRWVSSGPWSHGKMPHKDDRIVIFDRGKYVADYGPHEPIPTRTGYVNSRSVYRDGIEARLMRWESTPT